MFELLVGYGWNVNGNFNSQCPALGYVIEQDSLVEWLLLHGANPNIGREELWNFRSVFIRESGQVLDSAACLASLKTFLLLLEYGAQPRWSLALHHAASEDLTDDRRKIMEHLIEVCGMDVNQIDGVMMGPYRLGTPLFYAARNGNVGATRLLLKYGADASIQNHGGTTAVDEAERWHHTEVADLLRGSLSVEMTKLKIDDH